MATAPVRAAAIDRPLKQQHGGRHELGDQTWFDRLERLLQSWPITLRQVLLVAVVLTGTAAWQLRSA